MTSNFYKVEVADFTWTQKHPHRLRQTENEREGEDIELGEEYEHKIESVRL